MRLMRLRAGVVAFLAAVSVVAAGQASEPRVHGFLFTAPVAPGYAQRLLDAVPGAGVVRDDFESEAREQTPLAAARSGVDTHATLRHAAGDLALRGAAIVFVHTRGDALGPLERVARSFPNTRFVVHSPRPAGSALPNLGTYALHLPDAAYVGGMLAAAAKGSCALGLLAEDQPGTEPVYREAFRAGAQFVRPGAVTHVEVVQDANPSVRAQALDRLARAGVCVLFVRGQPFDGAALARHPRLAVIGWEEGGAPHRRDAGTIGQVSLGLAEWFGRRAGPSWSNGHATVGARDGVFRVEAEAASLRLGSMQAIRGRLKELVQEE